MENPRTVWPMPEDAASRLAAVAKAMEALRLEAVRLHLGVLWGFEGGSARRAAALEAQRAAYYAKVAAIKFACAALLDGVDDCAAIEATTSAGLYVHLRILGCDVAAWGYPAPAEGGAR